jgi:hypothetical protein
MTNEKGTNSGNDCNDYNGYECKCKVPESLAAFV